MQTPILHSQLVHISHTRRHLNTHACRYMWKNWPVGTCDLIVGAPHNVHSLVHISHAQRHLCNHGRVYVVQPVGTCDITGISGGSLTTFTAWYTPHMPRGTCATVACRYTLYNHVVHVIVPGAATHSQLEEGFQIIYNHSLHTSHQP